MQNGVGGRAPFGASSMQESEIKEKFYRYFQEEVTELQEQMGQLANFSLVGGERQDAIDHCLAGITRLADEVADATGFIPAYDLRTYSQAIKALTEKLQETRSKFAPRPRFQFKGTQKNGSAISLTDAAQMAAEQRLKPSNIAGGMGSSNESSMATTPLILATPPSERGDTLGDLPSLPKNYNEEMNRASGPVRKPSFSQATNVNISGHNGLHIILPSSASRATSSGALTRLNRCIVDMSVPTAKGGSPFAGLALKNIKHSLIIAGHVAGAAHITGVEDSIIVVASRQVRMHDCKNVDIYLHCASRPIIEDCANVRFAPIPKCHTSNSEDPAQNQWDQVDDFKWLKAEHSPNWSLLPEEERLQDDVWTNVVPGGPGVGPEDILKKVGLTSR
ncbi:TBCC-domain-containing protein [Coleophoma crateriformis]|uniref:TBCC-domain-containing protein n=1 Tax=Coleophoma crateriformis TaxID=565419 RepID=A0A3D8RIP5_9HELO|nr:TBCC-domain-containing protein [Coleophoma crateriformis]